MCYWRECFTSRGIFVYHGSLLTNWTFFWTFLLLTNSAKKKKTKHKPMHVHSHLVLKQVYIAWLSKPAGAVTKLNYYYLFQHIWNNPDDVWTVSCSADVVFYCCCLEKKACVLFLLQSKQTKQQQKPPVPNKWNCIFKIQVSKFESKINTSPTKKKLKKNKKKQLWCCHKC